MESELQNIEKFCSDDNRMFFFTGVVKAYTDLDIETVLKFVGSIYSSQLSEEVIRDIERFLLDGKLGKVKELLDSNRCGICSVLEGEKIKIACGHFFHINCLVLDITNKIDNIKIYLCMACNQHIPKIEECNKNVKSKVKDYRLAKFYEKHINKYPCPKCQSPCEGDHLGFAYCSICSITLCMTCLKISGACKCNLNNKKKSLFNPLKN